MSCLNNFSDINETFIVEPVGAIPSLTACTGVYTDAIISCSGNTQIFMGTGVITFDGNIYTNDNITASTINASTFYSAGTNIIDIINNSVVEVTGGTFNNVTDTLSLYNNKGGTLNVTGFTDYYTTGATLIGKTVYFDRNDMLSAYTLNLSSFSSADIYSTGVTFSNNQIIIARNDGVNLNTFINTFTGLTINGSLYVTDIIANTISANTISATTFYGDGSHLTGLSTQDTKITAFTYNNNTFTIADSTGGTFNALFNAVTGLTVDGVLSATTLSGGTIYGNGSGLTNVILAVSGGTGISATTIDGKVTLINTATNQAITITGGTNIEVVSNYPNFGINYTGQTVFDYLSLSGGTVTGDTNFTHGLTANTISAATYYNLPKDVYVTGGTYTSSTGTIGFVNNTGGTFNVNGLFKPLDDIYTTGFTFNTSNYDLTIKRNNGLPDLTQSLSILASDLTITGGTYNPNNGVATFTNNTGGTFNVSGFTSGLTDTYTTGFTYNNNTLTISDTAGKSYSVLFNTLTGLTVNGNLSVTGNTNLGSLSATSISAATYYNLPKDVYVTGGTYSAGTAVFTNNTGGTFSVSGFSTSATTSTQFTGGTVSGATIFTNGLSANTISATTYYNLPKDVYVTGGTYTSSTGTIGFINNTGGTFDVNGLFKPSDDIYTTGFTFDTSNYNLIIKRNGGLGDLTQSLSILASDLNITGGTYNPNTGVATFTNNTGGTFNVSGFTSGLTDTIITGYAYTPSANTFTINQSNGSAFTATFTSVSGLTVNGNLGVTGNTVLSAITANTISATTYYNLPKDVYVTGGTYSAGTTIFTNNTGGTFTITGFSTSTATQFTGGTVSGATIFTSGLSANTISATTYSNLPNTLYTGDGSLSGNRIVALSSYTLTFSSLTGSTLVVNNSYVDIGNNQGQVRIGSAAGNRYIRATVNNVGLGVGSTTYGQFGTNFSYSNRIRLLDSGNTFTRIDLNESQTSQIGSTVGAEIAFQPQVNHVDGSHTIRGYDWSGVTGVKGNIYIYPSKNLTDNAYGDIFLQYDGTSSRGNVGIGVSSVTNKLTVSAATNPVKFLGLTANTTDLNVVSVDSTGVLHTYPISGITAATSANTFVTGATYLNNTFTFTNNSGNTFSVLFKTVSGLTVNGNLNVTGNTVLSALSATSISTTSISATTYNNLPNTLYTGNGSLSGNRVVNIDNYTLNFSSSTYPNNLVLSGGNVGIGTSSPLAKLHVGNASSFLKVTNNWFNGNGTWLDLSLDGPSGVGSGGPGINPFFAYVAGAGNWFTDAQPGDVAYRNVSGKLLFGNTSFNAGMALSNSTLGIGTVNPTNLLHVLGTTDPLRLEGVVQNNTDLEYLTIDTQGIVHKVTAPSKKFIIRSIEMGSKFFGDYATLLRFFVHSFEQKAFDIVNSSSYNNCLVDYYYTINDGSIRKKILFKTASVYDYQNSIDNLIAYIAGTNVFANIYFEIYFPIDLNQGAPTQIKLVNPLFNSLNPSKNSRHGARYGFNEYVRNTQIAGGNSGGTLKSSNTLLSNFYQKWPYYYRYQENDIPKQIWNIVGSNTFYGSLSGYSQQSLGYNGTWDADVREIIKNSVYIESNTKFYSKFKIPVNQHSFFEVCKNNWNNFYGEIIYDYVGGSNSTVAGQATTDAHYSEAFLQLIDTYRLLPNGEPSLIYHDGIDSDMVLNGLSYQVGIPKELKYISKPSLGYTGLHRDRSFIQVLPGYNDVYILEISVNGSPSLDSTEHVFLSDIKNSIVPNDLSLINNQYWDRLSTNNTNVLSWLGTDSNFNGKGYGNYIVLQSNETKINDLIAYNNNNDGWTGPNGSIVINAIYKGWTFRPMIFPLNLNQILLEVNESFFYNVDNDSIEPSINSANNEGVVGGSGITNKKLRLIINYKKLNKMQCITNDLVYTSQRSEFDNTIFQLTTSDNIENIIINNIHGNWLKNIKPGNIEIYFAFYDTNLGTMSLIPNYKIIVARYGDNEIFKLIRD